MCCADGESECEPESVSVCESEHEPVGEPECEPEQVAECLADVVRGAV